MASIISAGNATNGLAISSDNTGILQLKTGTGAGTTAVTLDASQNATFAGTVTSSTGTLYPIIGGAAVASTSGTSVDIATNLPSWVKRVTVMLNGVSTNGTAKVILQLGTGVTPTYTTSGYNAAGVTFNGSATGSNRETTGFPIDGGGGASLSASSLRYGQIIFTSTDGLTWFAQGQFSNLVTTYENFTSTGAVTLAAALTSLRLTTVGGANTFDAGTVNIFWE